MFEDLDFDILNHPAFKEDSVREEIISPILRRLGYSATGKHRITRSKTLSHPYVMIGSRKHPVSIIPDYVLSAGQGCNWVLDAKAPSEQIYRSSNVEQVYSYAIHPEVRAKIYALCNGREFIVYDLFESEPILRFNIADIENQWFKLNNVLSPSAVQNPETREYLPDFGKLVVKAGYNPNIEWWFPQNEISYIVKANDQLYTTSTEIEVGGQNYIITFDFNVQMFNKLLAFAPEELRIELLRIVSCAPYHGELSSSFDIGIKSHVGAVESAKHEEFIPLIVTDITSPVDLSSFQRMQG